jgi:hypothetical protein
MQYSTALWPAQQAASLAELEACSASRRRMLASAALLTGLAAAGSSSSPAKAAEDLDLTITDRVSSLSWGVLTSVTLELLYVLGLRLLRRMCQCFPTVSGSKAGPCSSTPVHFHIILSLISANTMFSTAIRTRSAINGHIPTYVCVQIYFDIGVASSAFKPANDRMLGDKNVLPTDAEPAGRIVIGKQHPEALGESRQQ